jgi:hypothetical protein
MLQLFRLGVLGLYLWVIAAAFVAGLGGSIVAGLLLRGYHLLRGRRDRDTGLPCVYCRRTAFPVEGSTRRYRCWGCGSRFEGAEHF